MVTLNHPLDEVWPLWVRVEALEWRHLPQPGALGDQDEALLDDLLTLSAIGGRVRGHIEKQKRKQQPPTT